jgi:hypothetical protein
VSDPADLHELMADAVDGLTPQPPSFARLEAVRRRRRRHRLVTAGAIASATVLAVAGWLATGTAGPGRESQKVQVGPVGPINAKPVATAKHRSKQARLTIGGNVFSQPIAGTVTVNVGGLYAIEILSPPGAAAQRSELARIDAATGRVEAVSQPILGYNMPLYAAGSLWLTASPTGGTELLRLDARTLRTTGQWPLAGAVTRPLSGRDLAVAGGWLWVAAEDQLLRVSLSTGQVTLSVPIPQAAESNVAANAAGTILVDGQANSGGMGTVERRNPTTGALLASQPSSATVAPVIGGVSGSSVWIQVSTGMMGNVERLNATTLSLSPSDLSNCKEGRSTPTCIFGSNGITPSLANGHLWVTQLAGLNYCANPTSGHVLGRLSLPQPGEDSVLAIGPKEFYYTVYDPRGSYLREQPLPLACQGK